MFESRVNVLDDQLNYVTVTYYLNGSDTILPY